jgi:hypothetical protein
VSALDETVIRIELPKGGEQMAGVKRFEDIRAWQEAHQLTRQIYKLCDSGSFAKDFGLRDQIRHT